MIPTKSLNEWLIICEVLTKGVHGYFDQEHNCADFCIKKNPFLYMEGTDFDSSATHEETSRKPDQAQANRLATASTDPLWSL